MAILRLIPSQPAALPFDGGRIRPWLPGDAHALADLADNRAVWRNLRDAFPNPYTRKDARAWIRMARRQVPLCHYAIEIAIETAVEFSPAALSPIDPGPRPGEGGGPREAMAGAGFGKAVPASGYRVAGGIGLILQNDVYAGSAEIGYWLGEPFWGRGLMTSALAAFTAQAFAAFGLRRIFARVFAWNPASMRVLEKCGYVREGYLRRSVIKDGEEVDEVLFARLAE